MTAGRDGSGWAQAPLVVKSWAFTFAFLCTWLVAVVGAFVITLGLANDAPRSDTLWACLVSVPLVLLFHWQRTGLKRGAMAAWIVQIPISLVGLVWFPIGTVIHGYILSQWFRRDVRAWFRK